MRSSRFLSACAVVAFTALVLSILAGCAGKKHPWGEPGSGLILEYRMTDGEVLKYEVASESTEKVEVMGQTNESQTSKDLVFSVTPKGMEGENLRLGITIDSMEASMKTLQGEFSADTEGLAGQNFDIIVSPLGIEVDVSQAENVEYSIGPAGTRNLKQEFESHFFDLPGRPVKVGDSWDSSDEVTADQGNAVLSIETHSVHTLDGYETVEGLECARINSEVAGTITGEGEQMGAPLVFDGTIEGTETWYFAYKKGYLVKASSGLDSDLMVTVQAGQEMKVPVEVTSKSDVTLLK
jgi:hypothetical protein